MNPARPGVTRALLAPAALVLLLAACKEEDFQVVVGSTAVLDAPRTGAREKDTLLFSQRVKLKAPLPWKGKDYGENAQGFVNRADVAAFPLNGEPRFVVKDGAPIGPPRNLPDGARALVARGGVSLGEKLVVVADAVWLAPGQVAMVKDGAVRGFLAQDVVSATPPAREAMQAALQKQVLLRRMDAVERLARNARALFPAEAWSARLLAEVVRAKGDDDEADALLKDVAAAPDLPVLPGVPAVAFKNAWVGTAETVLRAGPQDGARVLDVLRANHPVAVVGVDKGMASVRTNLGHLVALDPFGQGRVEFPGGSQVTGFVPMTDLASSPLDEEDLVGRGSHALDAAKYEDALVLLSRAAALHPRESTQALLVDASFKGGRFDLMFQGLRTRDGPDVDGRGARRPSLLLGCAGNMAAATFFNAANSSGVWVPLHEYTGLLEVVNEPGFCLAGVDPRAPCPPRFRAPDCSRSLSEEDCLAPARQEHESRVGEFKQKVLPGFHANQKSLARNLRDTQAYLRFFWKDMLDQDVMALLGKRAREDTMTFYMVPIHSVELDTCEAGGALDMDEVVLRSLQLPRMVGTSINHVLVKVPSVTGFEYGAALATQDEVTSWLHKRPTRLRYQGRSDPEGRPVDGEDPLPPFPLVRVKGPPEKDCARWCVD
jgi:hypothetical protein